MLLSAYWHGLHPGYYLSFLTIPLCLAAERQLESALRYLQSEIETQRQRTDIWVQGGKGGG